MNCFIYILDVTYNYYEMYNTSIIKWHPVFLIIYYASHFLTNNLYFYINLLNKYKILIPIKNSSIIWNSLQYIIKTNSNNNNK